MVDTATVRIVRDVRDWLSSPIGRGVVVRHGQPGPELFDCLEMLLRARQDWLNSPDPTLWKTGDVHRLLVDVTAARLTDVHRLSEHGPAAIRALIDFLDETDRFHPASMRVAALRKELDRASARFPTAMADESVWRLAKRVFTALLAEGVDPEDDIAVDDWAAALSAAPAQRRRALLGSLLDRQPELVTARFVIRDSQVAAIAPGVPVPPEFRRHDPDTCQDCLKPPENPPVALPTVTEVADAARGSALIRNLVACGQWAGPGRPVLKHGFPSPGDTRSLAAAMGFDLPRSVRDPRDHLGMIRTWRLALDAEVLRLHRTAVVAGPQLPVFEQTMAGVIEPYQALRLWKDVADYAVTEPTLTDTKDPVVAQLTEFSRPWGPRALGELYRIAGAMAVENLIGTLVTGYCGSSPGEGLVMTIGVAVRGGLRAAVEAGVVTVTVPANARPEVSAISGGSGSVLGEPAWAVAPVPGAVVELTPLGRYFVRLNLLAEGTHAPLLKPATVSPGGGDHRVVG